MFRIDTPKTSEQLAEYFDLRWQVLRSPWNQPRGSERDALDAIAKHVAVYDANDKILGVGRLHLNSPGEAQIRYMATLESCRGKGVGRILVSRLESLASQCDVHRIVLNSREDAVGFYRHLGYHVVESGPTLFGEIPHFKMKKVLE